MAPGSHRRHPWSTDAPRTLAAVAAVLEEARAAGTSTADLESLDRTLRAARGDVGPIDVARLDAEIDAVVRKPIDEPHTRLWLDASHHRTWVQGSRATTTAVVALAVDWKGGVRTLGLDVGERGFILWATLLHGLGDRGLTGVRQVIAASHPGVQSAITAALPTARWLPLQARDDPAFEPLMRLRADFMRRSRIIGTFPSRKSLRRLLGAILADAELRPEAAPDGSPSPDSRSVDGPGGPR
jgi:transposase-like protein